MDDVIHDDDSVKQVRQGPFDVGQVVGGGQANGDVVEHPWRRKNIQNVGWVLVPLRCHPLCLEVWKGFVGGFGDLEEFCGWVGGLG